MKVKMPYDSFDQESFDTGLRCSDVSLAVQDQAEDADINTIVRRFGITGQLPARGTVPLVTNGEFVPNLTYQEALDIIIAGRKSFEAMPAEVRGRFDNDPAKFVDFCSDVETNRAELERLGLAVPKAKVVDPVVPEAPKT